MIYDLGLSLAFSVVPIINHKYLPSCSISPPSLQVAVPVPSSSPTSYYVNSLIQILHCVSDNLVQCDAETKICALFDDNFDDLDLELALTCFEATHKLTFKDSFWKSDVEDFEENTLEEFIETHLDTTEQTDPLHVTKRFLFYERSFSDAMRDELEGPPPTLN